MAQRRRVAKTMTPNVGGQGATMRALPGSQRMVGGPHVCMYHRIEASPLRLEDWRCCSVYMHIAREPLRPYVGADCLAVLRAVNEMNADAAVASGVLLRGDHALGHPLPGVYTLASPAYRVDVRAYEHNGMRHLWAEVYRL